MLHLLRLFLVLFAFLSAVLPAGAQEPVDISDLSPDTIERAMLREASRGGKVAALLKIKKEEAKAKLDALEKRYQELRLAAYYQDNSNFFYLTYYCRAIAELRSECTGGKFPFFQTMTRMEMALKRYTYLRQALQETDMAMLSPAQQAQLHNAAEKCAAMEKEYRVLYNGLMEEQHRYEDLLMRIRKLDIYANGREVETYTAVSGGLSTSTLRKISEFVPTGAPAKQEQQAAAPADARSSAIVAQAAETTLAYGTSREISGEATLADEQEQDGRLAACIALALWDTSHPDRQMLFGNIDFGTLMLYLGKSFYNNYIDPYDVVFAGSLRFMGVVLLCCMAVSVLLCTLLFYALKRRRLRYSRQRIRAFVFSLGFLFCAAGMYWLGGVQHLGYMSSHTHVLAVFLLLTALLFASLTVRISSCRLNNGLRLFFPFFFLNLLLITYCVMMCPGYIVAVTSPFIFLLCGIWMALRFLSRMKNFIVAVRVFAVLSIIIMFLGAYVCAKGYYYCMILAELCWYVFVTNLFLMSAIAKLSKLLCRRIYGNPRLRGYRHYLCMWVRLVVVQMVLPMLFLGLIWYGLRWPADAFDLKQFFVSWMGRPHHIGGAIRSLSADKLILIFSVGICVNCALQIIRSTLALIYGSKAEAGRSQMFVTIGSMVAWGGFIIFALNELDADYSSILVVMGGMSVGVGLGLKDTIDNLVSGLSLMLGRMRPGDVVECDGVRGSVANIGYRTTTLETVDGSVICFQNAQLFSQNFRNMTRNHQFERCVVSIGVTYGTDVARARKLVLQALRRLPGLSARHPSSVLLENFGDSSVDLSVVVWVPVTQKVAMLSRVREIVYNTFNDNNIEIPFPQQDLHIIQSDAAALFAGAETAPKP